MAIKVLIFDLDDTLLDSTEQMRWRGIDSACSAMRAAGLDMKHPACSAQLTRDALKLMSVEKAIGKLCKEDEKLAKAGYDAYHDFDVAGITLYDGVHSLLEAFRKRYKLVLLTSGDMALQKRKIAELGLEKLFDTIRYDYRNDGGTKKDGLAWIAEHLRLKPDQCVVIGDRIDNELRYGKELGMKTVLVKVGPYATLEPTCKEEKPDYTVDRITDVDEAVKAVSKGL